MLISDEDPIKKYLTHGKGRTVQLGEAYPLAGYQFWGSTVDQSLTHSNICYYYKSIPIRPKLFLLG